MITGIDGRKVSVGETVIVELPMSFPVGSAEMTNVNMIMKYTLNDITNGIADFDISYTAKVQINTESGAVNFNGSGQGKMTYDTIRLYTPKMDSVLTMDMSFPMGTGNLITKNITSTKLSTRLN